jgi:hypothetical protein
MKEDTTTIDLTWMSKTCGFARDMTLRDHYAGLAMLSMINRKDYDDAPAIAIAIDSSTLADAMLKARAK